MRVQVSFPAWKEALEMGFLFLCATFYAVLKRAEQVRRTGMDRSYTAMVLKEFEDADKSKHFRLALRLLTSEDVQYFKNSVITFMKIREKEYMRLVKNKQVLYKKE